MAANLQLSTRLSELEGNCWHLRGNKQRQIPLIETNASCSNKQWRTKEEIVAAAAAAAAQRRQGVWKQRARGLLTKSRKSKIETNCCRSRMLNERNCRRPPQAQRPTLAAVGLSFGPDLIRDPFWGHGVLLPGAPGERLLIRTNHTNIWAFRLWLRLAASGAFDFPRLALLYFL